MAEIQEIEGDIQVPESSLAHGVWMRKNARTAWHAVIKWHVYIYAAMGGGFDAIVSGITLCKQSIPVDEAQVRNDRPDRSLRGYNQAMCVNCQEAIEEAL